MNEFLATRFLASENFTDYKSIYHIIHGGCKLLSITTSLDKSKHQCIGGIAIYTSRTWYRLIMAYNDNRANPCRWYIASRVGSARDTPTPTGSESRCISTATRPHRIVLGRWSTLLLTTFTKPYSQMDDVRALRSRLSASVVKSVITFSTWNGEQRCPKLTTGTLARSSSFR